MLILYVFFFHLYQILINHDLPCISSSQIVVISIFHITITCAYA